MKNDQYAVCADWSELREVKHKTDLTEVLAAEPWQVTGCDKHEARRACALRLADLETQPGIIRPQVALMHRMVEYDSGGKMTYHAPWKALEVRDIEGVQEDLL